MANCFASTTEAWSGWIGDAGTANSITTTSTASDTPTFTWNVWATVTSTTATETGVAPWTIWQSIVTPVAFNVSKEANWRPPAPPTAGELEAKQEKETTLKRKRKQLAAAREVAGEKAKVLLEECLSPAQKRAYRRWGIIPVVATSGKRYRIEKGSMGNVVEVENRKVVARFCCHPTMQGGVVPDHDVMLAQKLMLEVDEEAFLKLANKTTMHQLRRAVA